MTYYTRHQIVELLAVDDEFITALEREEIVTCDAPDTEPPCFSAAMLERIRAADTLVHELDVNLPGVSVILRMREELAAVRRRLEELASAGQPLQRR